MFDLDFVIIIYFVAYKSIIKIKKKNELNPHKIGKIHNSKKFCICLQFPGSDINILS